MEENPGYSLEIFGHADNQGSSEYNSELSNKRAVTVRNYMMEKGVSSERLIVVGKGESEPVATNETPEGRALNRRVAFVVKW
jgi:outer membrane protein OmpA-like peptidoglycan-associated protein